MTDMQTTSRGIAWRVDGPDSAPALLLLNSLGTTCEIWDTQIPAFAGPLRVIRVDTRGHSRSSVLRGEYTIEDLGLDALGVLDAAGVDRAHVCGVSLGGMTAMWLAAHAPERVRTLFPVSTALRIGVPTMWEERIRQVTASGIEPLADASMGRWFTPGFIAAHPATVAGCRRMLTGVDIEGYVGCCAVLRDADLHAAASRMSAPALVIVGASDPVTPPADALDIQKAIAGARLLTLDASHICAVERAAEFNDAVLGFIRGRE